MIKNIIKSLLFQPDVIGIAISELTIIPYFLINENTIDISHKMKIENELRQKLRKNSTSLDRFEFQVSDYIIYTRKISSKFRLIVVLTNQNKGIYSLIDRQINSAYAQSSLQSINSADLLKLDLKFPSQNIPDDPTPDRFNATDQSKEISKDLVNPVSIQDLLGLINRLSLLVTRFIGAKIATAYWIETRPNFNYLKDFTIDKSAQFQFSGNSSKPIQATMQLGFKLWLNAFFDKSSKFISNLPELIEMECEDQNKQEILSIIPAAYLCKNSHSQGDDMSLFDDI